MRGARVDEMRSTQLADSTESPEDLAIQDRFEAVGKVDVTPQGIAAGEYEILSEVPVYSLFFRHEGGVWYGARGQLVYSEGIR